jgi:acetylglutamate kinase
MKFVGIKVVLIHGGGKQITKMMEEKNIEVKFVDGLRVTTPESMKIVQMVLLGNINTNIVKLLNKHGNSAVGICGNDGNFIECKKKYHIKDNEKIDLGLVGDIKNIDSGFVKDILDNNLIPVIASLGTDRKGDLYNINADTCASEIAIALKAEKMILLTDVDGIIDKEEDTERLVSKLDTKSCIEMINSGKIGSGMIPKVKACTDSLKGGVGRTHILNGTKKHSILIEIFTDRGIGTMIVKEGDTDGL